MNSTWDAQKAARGCGTVWVEHSLFIRENSEGTYHTHQLSLTLTGAPNEPSTKKAKTKTPFPPIKLFASYFCLRSCQSHLSTASSSTLPQASSCLQSAEVNRFSFALENPVGLLGQESPQLRSPSSHNQQKSLSRRGLLWAACTRCCSNTFRAAGPSCGLRSWNALKSRLQLAPLTQHLAFVKQFFKKHHSLGGKILQKQWNSFPVAPAFPASFPRQAAAWLAILPSSTPK